MGLVVTALVVLVAVMAVSVVAVGFHLLREIHEFETLSARSVGHPEHLVQDWPDDSAGSAA
ncbi:MAG TPA: hypothetical protein VKU88_11875 [Acidimicrobiales bacterium]|nr:hypothetical protein [Acidimicrobiales bacterium]